jgi:thiamine-phosphate pyrophosphorylase
MNLDLYVIIGGADMRGITPAGIAKRAIAGGADVIQFRDKHGDSRDLLRTAKIIRAITQKSGTLFIVNDRLDIAIACGADGVHLGQGDMPPATARQLAPPGFIIGVSVGTVEEALGAVLEGADYLALSPTFATLSKDDAGPGHGLGRLREIRRAISIPLIAIGGINCGNVPDVIAAGADGIAVISAVVDASDVTTAARDLKHVVQQSKKSVRS